jgi:hypothetical protein
MSREQVIGYLLGHRGAAPDGLGCALAADFGDGGGEQPPSPPDTTTAHDYAIECIRVLDEARFVTRARDNEQAWHDVGSIVDYLDRIAELTAPKAPGPGPNPPPAPTALLGFAVSYGGHDPARDVYLGRTAEEMEWGAHHNHEIVAPAPGRVEAYWFSTPLADVAAASDEYAANWMRLFADGPPCCPARGVLRENGVEVIYPKQTMAIAVYWPDAPLNGLRALWFGHVRPDIAVGRVEAGQRICTAWDSGVRFEDRGIQARAAHVHCCASATGTLSPNGDVDSLRAAAAMGWQVEWRGAGGPGPEQYLSGLWAAGKPRSAWAGRTLPPVPS